MTGSNLVGCSTERSAGFAPLRILSTRMWACRTISNGELLTGAMQRTGGTKFKCSEDGQLFAALRRSRDGRKSDRKQTFNVLVNGGPS